MRLLFCWASARLSEELARQEKEATDGAANLWARARIVIDRDGDEKALPLLEQILAIEPHHPAANFVLGRWMLQQEDGRGVEHVEHAMDLDRELTSAGCELLHGYFGRNRPDRKDPRG